MAKLKIFTFPDVILTKKAAPIERVEKELHGLADDMFETMYSAPGIGLAANQVGILKRILVLDIDYDLEDVPEGIAPPSSGVEVFGTHVIKNRKPQIMINPQIIKKEGTILFTEGCLSVPEYTAEVKRVEKLVIEYKDIDGVTRKLAAEGLLAVAIQHEMDHLDGKLFIDRLSPIKKELARKRLKQERVLRDSGEEVIQTPPSSSKKSVKGF